MELDDRFVVPLDQPLEVGAPADLAVLAADPRGMQGPGSPRRVAVIRGGHVVEGSLAPGGGPVSAA